MAKHMNFITAESIAFNKAYEQVFQDLPRGVGIAIIRDRKAGIEWSKQEEDICKALVNKAIQDNFRKNLEQMIIDGIISDCHMSRVFMAGLTVAKLC